MVYRRAVCTEPSLLLWHDYDAARRKREEKIIKVLCEGEEDPEGEDFSYCFVEGEGMTEPLEEDITKYQLRFSSSRKVYLEAHQEEYQQAEQEKGHDTDREVSKRLSGAPREAFQYTHRNRVHRPPPSIISLLPVNKEVCRETQDMYLKENTFIFACCPSQILGSYIPVSAIERMQHVQFAGPTLNMAGRHDLDNTCEDYGSTVVHNAVWAADMQMGKAHWLRFLKFMDEKMTLKEVGIEFSGRSWFSILAGGTYLWHIARKMTSWWTDGRIAKLAIFQDDHSRFDAAGHRFKQNNLLKIMQ